MEPIHVHVHLPTLFPHAGERQEVQEGFEPGSGGCLSLGEGNRLALLSPQLWGRKGVGLTLTAVQPGAAAGSTSPVHNASSLLHRAAAELGPQPPEASHPPLFPQTLPGHPQGTQQHRQSLVLATERPGCSRTFHTP